MAGDYVARAGGPGATTGPWTAEAHRFSLQQVTYDANGNLRTLQRRGWLTPTTFGLVDQLTYAYAGNRLQAVADQVSGNTLPRPAGYAGAPTSLAGDFQEPTTQQAQEYDYDVTGNLTADRNKGITDIRYNHLHLPRRITFGPSTGADSLVFRYSATGQKVAKFLYQRSQPLPVRTDYVGGWQYEQDTLRFFPHAEGRVLRSVSPTSGAVTYEREFTVKDHLGNLRLAYRAGRTLVYEAGLEPGDAARETHQFDSVSVSAPIAYYVGANQMTNPAHGGAYVARLNAGTPTPHPLGPLLQLRVQKQDTVQVIAPGYYAQPSTTPNFLFSLLSYVATRLQQQPAGPRRDGRPRALPWLHLGVSAGLPALNQPSGGVPKGYVRLLVFDADSNLVSTHTRQLSSAAFRNYEDLTLRVPITQDGYVTAYVGNESDADVYFDDVRIEHQQGLQVQETHYDPVGLELAGLAPHSPGLKPLNQYQFNGQEFQADLGLNWNHQDWRFFDPQLGRWHTVDPLSDAGQEMWSPYSFGFNNALRFSDPDGRCPTCPPTPGLPNDFMARGFFGVGMSVFNLAAQAVATVLNTPYKYQSNFVENEDTGQAIDTQIQKVPREGFIAEAKSAGLDGLIVGLTFAGGGGQGKLLEQAAGKVGIANVAQGSVSLDTNALVAAVQGGEANQVIQAAAGRQMTVSTTAAKEFLAKGDKAGLKSFMQNNGVQMAKNGASESQVQGLQQMAANQGKVGQGRVLKTGDASVVGGAQNNGATLMTRDSKLANFMRASGFPVIGF